MQDIKVYKAEGILLDEREMSMSELPSIPEYFTEALLEAGGTCNDLPNVRVVSGLDPTILEWIGGRWWRKYAFREHIVHEYTVLHKPDGTKHVLTPKEAEIVSKAKLEGILIPVVDRKIIEHGIPRYFVEYYKPPETYGSPEAWEMARWEKGEDGKTIDLMGEFPKEGSYETWFMVETAIEENGEVVKTVFRELDDIVLELIKTKIEEAKKFTPAEQHAALRKEVDEEYIQHQTDLKTEIKNIVADRIDRIVN